jgi:predicted kinase
MHATAAIAAGEDAFGTPDKAHRNTLDNFEEIARVLPGRDEAQCVARLRGPAQRRFEAGRPLMAQRRQHGRIRECHGDLHCGNVVRWRGRLTPFDGIEFDPALRFIDVVNDLAFLTMDLAARGRADLRHAALDAWTESLGDYASLPLLPYYEVYRALVRAKVAGLRTRQHAPGSQSFRAALADVQRYLDWALAGARRAPPMLMITCGLSGSGKTWLARRLAPELGALHVRSDVERKRLAGLAPLADSRSPPDAGLYTREFNTRTYARLAECAQACLQGGESVIVDAAFLRRAERSDLMAVGGRAGAKTAILHCAAPLDTLRARIASRRQAGGDASEADVSLLDRQPAYWEALSDAERGVTIDVDTTSPQSVDECVARLRRDTGS